VSNAKNPLAPASKQEALRRILEKRRQSASGEKLTANDASGEHVPESYYRFEKFSEYQTIDVHRTIGDRVKVENPFFIEHEGCAADTTRVGNRDLISFGTYNYLGLNGHPAVNAAAMAATEYYGTSASASRLVSGERPVHRQLEACLAELCGTESAIAMVSGHATNVTTIGTFFNSRDLIVHDRLIHSSILQGAQLSGAQRLPFEHNDWAGLDRILTRSRKRFAKILIAIEGLYSMDGDIAPVDKFVEVARKHKAILMVDEAHSMGSLGATGRGVREHFDLKPGDVDIYMGTLSKTFAGCGGYIAGSEAMVEILRYGASGFVFSVGMPPPIAAAAMAATELMLAEPKRVTQLQANTKLFLTLAKDKGLDTGLSEGINVVPVIIGNSLLTVRLSNALFDRGISVPPIIHPAVEEKAARLRYFFSSEHSEEQIRYAVDTTAEELARLKQEAILTPANLAE
jgi:8-amino-7-oxononanoate synthase